MDQHASERLAEQKSFTVLACARLSQRGKPIEILRVSLAKASQVASLDMVVLAKASQVASLDTAALAMAKRMASLDAVVLAKVQRWDENLNAGLAQGNHIV